MAELRHDRLDEQTRDEDRLNSEVRIPMISVVAKPCTGPLPKTKRTIPVMIVVS